MRIIKNSIQYINNIEIFDPRDGLRKPLRLWPKQIEALDIIHNYLNVIFLKSRQSGFSTVICGADSMVQCMRIENFKVLYLSKTGDDAIKLLTKTKELYLSFSDACRKANALTPVKLKNGKYDVYAEKSDHIGTVDTLEFKNGSSIISDTAFNGRGGTFDRVIIDEAAYITKTLAKIDLDFVYKAIDPTLDVARGQLILVSTANGMNTFFDIYEAARQKKSKFVCLFFGCYDKPGFTEKDRIDKESTYLSEGQSRDYVNQEYPRTELEAFLSSGRPRFDTESLQYYMTKPLPELFRGDLNDDGTMSKNKLGEFVIIQQRKQRCQYVIVADVAEGLDHGDNSVGKVFDRDTFDQIAEWCGKPEPSDFGTILCTLGYIYNNAIIIVERNKDGLATLDSIIKANEYPEDLVFEHDTLKREHVDDAFNNHLKRFGWRTDSEQIRKLIISKLAKMISARAILGFLIKDIEELFRFVIINGKAQAESGCHDDRVMVLCIAYYLLTSDAFEVAYPYIDFQEHMNCFTCIESTYRYGDTETVCQVTDRKKYKGDVCRMFRLREFD